MNFIDPTGEAVYPSTFCGPLRPGIDQWATALGLPANTFIPDIYFNPPPVAQASTTPIKTIAELNPDINSLQTIALSEPKTSAAPITTTAPVTTPIPQGGEPFNGAINGMIYRNGFLAGEVGVPTAFEPFTGMMAGAALGGIRMVMGGLASKSLVDSNTIRFTQESISNTFKNGNTLRSLAGGLQSGKVTAKSNSRN